MKKLICLFAFLGLGYMAAHAQQAPKPQAAQLVQTADNDQDKAQAPTAKANADKKKECSDKKQCSGKSSGKSCCSHKSTSSAAKKEDSK